MLTLYVAGMESTAKNLQAFFYALARNPEKQEKLYREIVEFVGESGPVSNEKLSRMPYLKAVSRKVQVLPCNHFNCMTAFSEAAKFLPERWIRSEVDRKLPQGISPFACLPFGYGPRNCIGRRFAEQEIYLAIIKILERAKIELQMDSKDVKFIYAIFIEPSKAINFRFVPRGSG
ncbi:cytochrome p450 302a1, mitochondrial-like [Plakobranchus ocellatus]|uniref:Cytochrome p450 302a1, mitochondrial-like n=1 Tax=Plakobranchus ocellatus TaxID=259542 RepID=A0AAV4B0U9_9GAST|nr:cytochrome p450 302a1, mitochondrial-like [Plakobranchus ocellatus]